MGSILQMFDPGQANFSLKLSTHKKHDEGPETPRNSLEFSSEMPQGSNIIHDDIDDIPYSCQVRQQHSKAKIMKQLMDEDMLKRPNDKCNTPSVIARLMGMDNLPSEVKPTILPKEWKDGSKPRSTLARNTSSSHLAPTSTQIKKAGQELVTYSVKGHSSQPIDSFRLTRPQPREHPQEELLQKFKKEFVEWQAKRIWEHSSSFEAENNHLRQKNANQLLAQENLHKEKIAKCFDRKHYVSTSNTSLQEQKEQSSQHESSTSKQLPIAKFDEKQYTSTSKQLDIEKSIKKQDRPSSTRIVILKPGSEQDDVVEENWSRSPEILEKEGRMKDFLEEVKERLKSKARDVVEENWSRSPEIMLGKAKNDTKARDIITEASFGERSPDTKQFARHIAKKIRESVTKDLRLTFIRSQSTKSYRSEVQLEYPESPKFINRDARRVLSDRMKNVLRNETSVEMPQVINQRTRMKKERMKSRSMHDFTKLDKKVNYLEDMKTLNVLKTTTIHGQEKCDIDAEPVSPRSLIRSFSAPMSGTDFGRLLLEDQHVLRGAHIHRKQDTSELSSQDIKKKRKDGFNLKGTVSNFRQNFILKGKLFGKKPQLVDEFKEPIEFTVNDFSSLKPIVTFPFVVDKFGFQDNSTEVPPSPASLTDSSQDDFFRPGHPSPVSPLQSRFIEDQSTPKLSTEISSMLSEVKELSEQVNNVGREEVAADEKPLEDEAVKEQGSAEGYVRDIFIAAGLYEAEASGNSFPRSQDTSMKLIPNWVFDKIEETYNKKEKSDDEESLLCYGDIELCRRMLFDLVNEAFPCALKVPTTSSRCKLQNRALGPNMTPYGKNLLDGLWSHIEGILNSFSNESTSLDNMVAEDVRIAPWFNVMHADADAIGRKLESIILADLINELLREISH